MELGLNELTAGKLLEVIGSKYFLKCTLEQ